MRAHLGQGSTKKKTTSAQKKKMTMVWPDNEGLRNEATVSTGSGEKGVPLDEKRKNKEGCFGSEGLNWSGTIKEAKNSYKGGLENRGRGGQAKM